MRRPLLLLTLFALVAPARAVEVTRVESFELSGTLLDDKQRLVRFLQLWPGAIFDAEQMAKDLVVLGYRVISEVQDPGKGGVRLKMVLKPQRVVRKVTVHGNWPLFDDEVLRHVKIVSGTRLPADDELQRFLDQEAVNVQQFLEKDGYFGGSVKIVPRGQAHQDWLDLEVNLDLGHWYRLARVEPQGNTAISAGQLFDIFDHCCLRWGRFSVARMREDARTAEKALRERGYPSARVRPDFNFGRDADPRTRRVRLPVQVSEKRRVEVRFVGNRAISDSALREQITLFTSGAYDEVELAESAKALQRAYQRRGYFEAKVTSRRKRATSDKGVEEATFIVDEGPELKVRAIDFASESGAPLSFGNEELRLKSGIETKVFPRLGAIGLGEGGYVTTLQVEQDAERVVALYRSRGFPEAQVRAEVARDPSSFGALGALGVEAAGAAHKNDLYVRFFVSEGRREQVERVEIVFKGEHKKSEADVRRVLRMTDGQPYTEAAFGDDAQHIVNLYKSSGRPYVQIEFGRSTWSAAHDRRVQRYDIAEGPDVTFGEILIRGNFKTLDRVILKDLPFRAGQAFDLGKLEEGERNLQTHLIFNSARVVPVGLSDGRNPVPILVTVQERYLEKAGSLAVAAGIQTDKLPYYSYVSAAWLWSNFFGLGSQLELRGDFGFSPDSFGVSLRYTDIRAFGPGWRFDLTAFVRRELTYRFGRIETYGASVGLARFLTPTLRTYLRYDNYLSQILVPFVRTDGPNDRQLLTDNTHTAKFSLGLVWDRRLGADNQPSPLMPLKGWLLQGSVGWAFPSAADNPFVNFFSSANNFVVVSGQALGLLPFKIRGTGFTLIANLRYDQGFAIDKPALPLVERFFAGGDTTTRGYDTDQLKTEIVQSEAEPLDGIRAFRVIPQGGNLRMLSTVEVQFPIAKSFLGLPWPWVGAVFWDVGAVGNRIDLLQGSDIKNSVGISLLRILTPVGPLSLEYAYPLNQSLAEERWKVNPWYSHFPGRIHFNWGIPLSRL